MSIRYVYVVLCLLAFNAASDIPPRPTGLVPDPHEEVIREIEAVQSEKLFQNLAEKDHWTFDYDVDQIGRHAMGFNAIADRGRPVEAVAIGDARLKSKRLSDFGKDLGKILDQGSCGSCVVFSILGNWTGAMKLRGLEYPDLSPQHLMNCGGAAGQCSGDYGSRVAQRLVNLKTLFTAQAYPYTARTSGCREQGISGQRYGMIHGFKSIDPSAQAMLQAIHNGLPISVGVAVNGPWASYRAGVYNACSSMRTNHYVVIEGVDCEDAVDAEGFCAFDARGNLPAGKGILFVRNSWGTQWGEQGYMRTRITDRSGRKCNNIAAEGEILDIGIPMPPDGPETFAVTSKQVTLKVHIENGALFTADTAKQHLTAALKALGD